MTKLICFIFSFLFLTLSYGTFSGPNADEVKGMAHLAKYGDLKTIKMLGFDPSELTDFKANPLYEASRSGHSKVLKYFIENGANPNIKNENGEVSLHALSINGDRKMASYLMKNGAKLNIKNNQGQTPLHEVKTKKLAHLFLTKDPSQSPLLMRQTNKLGQSPLHTAVLANKKHSYLGTNNKEAKSIIALMLKADGQASLNKKDQLGNTPLHYATSIAAHTGDMRIVKELLKKGADPNIKNKKGETSLMMLSFSSPFSTDLSLSEEQENLLDVQKMMFSRMTFDNSYEKAHALKLAKLLVSHKADVNAKNEFGQTLLHHSARSNPPLKDFLISKGADTDLKDDFGDSPFDIMMENHGTGTKTTPSQRRKSNTLR